MPAEFAEIALMRGSFALRDGVDTSVSPVAALVERAKSGEPAAFEQLIDCFQRKVLLTTWRMLGNREDARDAAQEVFLRVYKYLGSFRSDQDFAAWLYRIAINVCRDLARKRSKFAALKAAPERYGLDEIAGSENIESAVVRSQERSILARALDTLSRKERAALVLRDLEGLTTAEVAQVLGSTQTTVRSQISSARVTNTGKVRIGCARSKRQCSTIGSFTS